MLQAASVTWATGRHETRSGLHRCLVGASGNTVYLLQALCLEAKSSAKGGGRKAQCVLGPSRAHMLSVVYVHVCVCVCACVFVCAHACVCVRAHMAGEIVFKFSAKPRAYYSASWGSKATRSNPPGPTMWTFTLHLTVDPNRCPEIPPGPELSAVLWSLARKCQPIDRKQVAGLPRDPPETSVCVGLIRRGSPASSKHLLCTDYVPDLPPRPLIPVLS